MSDRIAQAKIRYTNLDIIKIIATILIVFHHYQQVFDCTFSGINFFGGNFYWGRMVELFFIISGFVTIAGDKKDDHQIIKPFLKKYLRFLPTVILSVVVSLIVVISFQSLYGHPMFSLESDYSGLNIICSCLLIFEGWGIDVGLGINNPTWYLCILLICYILYYVVKRLFKNRHLFQIFAYSGIAGISLILWYFKLASTFPFLSNSNVRGYSCFFIGIFIYEFTQICPNKKICTGLGIGMILLWWASVFRFGYNFWPALVVFLFPGIVLLAVSVKQINMKTITPGGVSFETYIWHVPMFRIIVLITSLLGISITHSYWSMILFTALIEMVAYFIYRYFELPVTKWLKRKLDGFSSD